MQSINFNKGYKEYAINGDENCVIRFIPSDFGILERMEKSVPVIEGIHQKYAESKDSPDSMSDIMSSCDKEIREQINYIFGNDVCAAAFGTTNCLSPAGGNLLYQNFLDALFPILEKDISAEKVKMEKNIKKYTSQVKE